MDFCANSSAVPIVQYGEASRNGVLGTAGGVVVTTYDDRRFLSKLRAGCQTACAELVRTHYQSVYRFVAHLTRDVHQAEDLTQETFTTAWEKIASFEGRATLATWLHRIAYTKFIDAQRARRRASGLVEHVSSARVGPADPLEAAIADDEAGHLARALDRLDTPERTLLVLHYFQGLSYREMAVVLDEPTGTVKWRTSEALVRLRVILTEKASVHAH
jgi:RNA polymerase sigma-70 factor (ECF subfamily)